MKLNFIYQVAFFSFFCFFMVSCTGFNRVNWIVERYYLVEVDTKSDLSICYETKNNDYIGKIPPTIISYGYNDTFLVAKTKNYDDHLEYYIVNMKRASDLAHEETFRVGPISENEYLNNWQMRLRIHLKLVD